MEKILQTPTPYTGFTHHVSYAVVRKKDPTRDFHDILRAVEKLSRWAMEINAMAQRTPRQC